MRQVRKLRRLSLWMKTRSSRLSLDRTPTTMMATLTTVRAVLRDVEMRKQAGVIQAEVGTMLTDVARLSDRVSNLRKHFDLANRDIDQIETSAGKVQTRGTRIHELDLGETEQEVLPAPDPTLLD